MDPSALTVWATKPTGGPALLLAEMGICIVPIEEDEGNVDRYILSKRLAVERRTAASFLGGIKDRTLFTSALYLREHFQIPVLIVEDDEAHEFSMFDPQAVRGALSSMMILYGLSVLATPDAEETAAILAMMARQEQIGIPEISLVPKRKAADLPDLQRRVVEMLPGCGLVMARELLQHFGSVRRIAAATEDELRTVRGLGAKTAKEIVHVLAADYEAVDTERNLEDAIQAAPELLFAQPVTLLARQHFIFSDAKDRHIVDMVFHDPAADELILVELKRGRLTGDHVRQLRRYLDHAHQSKLLRGFLDKGTKIRGILATVEPCELTAEDLGREGEAPAEPSLPGEGEAPAEPSSSWEGEAPAEPSSSWEGEAPAEPPLPSDENGSAGASPSQEAPPVGVTIVNRDDAIEVLKELRRLRLHALKANA